MKVYKKFYLVLLVFLLGVVLSSCTQPLEISLEFDSNGGSSVAPQLTDGKSITLPTEPTRDGYSFGGWFWDDKTFEIPLTTDAIPEAYVANIMTVYAKWYLQDQEQPTLTLTTDPIEITMWHALGTVQKALLQKYANGFMDLYPNITVNIPDSSYSLDALKSNVTSAIGGGTLPNLVQALPEHTAEYYYSDSVINLDYYIENDNYGLNDSDVLSDFLPSFRDECSQFDEAGSYYALPFAKSTEILIYNKTAYDEIGYGAPEVWQDFQSVDGLMRIYAEQFTNLNQMTVAAYESAGNAALTFAKQYHGSFTSINYDTMLGNYLFNSSPNTIAAMNFLEDNKAYITLPDFWDESYASTPFIQQKTFAIVTSSLSVRYNVPPIDQLTGLPIFQIGVAPVPYNLDVLESNAVIQEGTNISLMNTGTEQQQLASWLFLKYLTNTENTTDWALNTGFLPVRTSAYDSILYQELLNSPSVEQYYMSLVAQATYSQLDVMFFAPAFMHASRINDPMTIALERIMLGDGNVSAALQEAYDDLMIGW
ncbi:MAG: extracellular solute-binding protein [Firmicutes bacterium]|nr:extracellular solute-binding protein [Bacillota bacterium]